MQFPDWSIIDEERRFRYYRPLLRFLSIIYGLGIRLRTFSRSALPGKTLPGFVISVGNLTVGGTGKTPAVCLLAGWAREKGYRVAVLSRGYRGGNKQKILVVSDGEKLLAGVKEAGDEPVLLARKLGSVPVIVSRKRYDGGIWAYRHLGINFFILDDGFQHLALKRDLDLVLLDSQKPLGNGCLLPRGPLREPVSALKRSQALLLTRCEAVGSGFGKGENLPDNVLARPVFHSAHIPDKIVFPAHNRFYGPEFISRRRVVAFAGIARPAAFQEMLVHLGADIAAFKGFGDHHPYSQADIQALREMQAASKGDFMVTTEKDWIRLEKVVGACPELAYLTISLSILDKPEAFFEMIETRVKQKGKLKT